MAKSKKQSHVPLLSPENYIRQKARNLPIYECWLNKDWEEGRAAEIVIARKHANGNITTGLYVIDLGCMGVRNSYYAFNIDEYDYRKMLVTSGDGSELKMVQVSYTLVHNIIYAANEYAAELGFKPYKDFTSVAQFLLEEDTEDIELIEIECGLKGKPFYIQGDDTEAQAQNVMKQLDEVVGNGNFDYILAVNNPNDIDDDIDNMSFHEKRKLFLEMSKKEFNRSTVEEQAVDDSD
jgi:hypothetical protein